MNQLKPPDEQCTISIIGRRGVGKSSILNRWSAGQFSQKMSMTIGMDWQKRTITIHQKPYLINLIDNPGAKRFCGFARLPLRVSHAVIFVVNSTVRKTFDRLSSDLAWYSTFFPSSRPIVCIALSKTDLVNERQVSSAELISFCSEREYHYFEICSATGLNVESMISTLAQDIYSRHRANIPLAPITALVEDGEFSGSVGSLPDLDFSELLFPGQFTDTCFVHELNGLQIRLHSDIVALQGVTEGHMKRLQRIDFSRRVFWSFFQSLYGSQQLYYELCFKVLPSSSTPPNGSRSPNSLPLTQEPLTTFEKALELIQIASLYSICALRPATKWSESVFWFTLLPALTTTEKVTLMAQITPFTLKTDKFLYLAQQSLRGDLEGFLKEIKTNPDFLLLAKEEPEVYGSIIFSVMSTDLKATYEPAPLRAVPKMDQWICRSLTRAWKNVFESQRSRRSKASNAPSSSCITTQTPSSRDTDSRPNDIDIFVEGHRESRFSVPDWLLFMRWKWIRPLILACVGPKGSREICLSRSLTPNALELIIQFLYNDNLTETLSSRETCINILEVGTEFGILIPSTSPSSPSLSLATSSSPTSAPLIAETKVNNVLPTKAFHKLVKLCRASANALSLDNCLAKLKSMAPSGGDVVQLGDLLDLQQTVTFVAENAHRLKKTPENLALINQTQDGPFKQIFMESMKKSEEKVEDWVYTQ